MTTYSFNSHSEAQTLKAGRTLAAIVRPGDVLALAGDLGAGKTVLAKGLAEGLDVSGDVTSPTFNLLAVHRGFIDFNHFDLYRLERASELEDIDFWGVLESGGVSLIEWGDRFPEALPDERLDVTITVDSRGIRRFELSPQGPRGEIIARSWKEALSGNAPWAG